MTTAFESTGKAQSRASARQAHAEDDHTVLVLGTHGSFLIDARTGMPTGAVPLAYRDIVRWDVDEWHGSHLGQTLVEMSCVDVLDLGGWHAEGAYAPPEPGFRAL